jgi:transcriptional regulator with XRE-family HTH domain
MDLYGATDLGLIKKIGEQIKKSRLEQNLSQFEVAERTGLGRKTISNIESGKPFSVLALIQVLRVLDLLELLTELLTVKDVVSPRLLYKNTSKRRERASRKTKDDIGNSNETEQEW